MFKVLTLFFCMFMVWPEKYDKRLRAEWRVIIKPPSHHVNYKMAGINSDK